MLYFYIDMYLIGMLKERVLQMQTNIKKNLVEDVNSILDTLT